MSKSTTIKSVETLACDAGWRNYHFVKVTTSDGLVGWSEYDEGFGAPGVTAAIERLSARVIGKNAQGQITNKTLTTVLKGHSDAYHEQCRMK